MKAIKIITHPLSLIISFLLILISGEHLGAFYLLYILLALPHGGIHSLLAVAGIAIILFCNYKYKMDFKYLIEPLLNILGATLLILSISLFFYNDKDHYNYSTFYQILPMISLVVFALLITGFLIKNILKLRLTSKHLLIF